MSHFSDTMQVVYPLFKFCICKINSWNLYHVIKWTPYYNMKRIKNQKYSGIQLKTISFLGKYVTWYSGTRTQSKVTSWRPCVGKYLMNISDVPVEGFHTYWKVVLKAKQFLQKYVVREIKVYVPPFHEHLWKQLGGS